MPECTAGADVEMGSWLVVKVTGLGICEEGGLAANTELCDAPRRVMQAP